jgi:hypothetical protein
VPVEAFVVLVVEGVELHAARTTAKTTAVGANRRETNLRCGFDGDGAAINGTDLQ